jgi:hypothetical protein
VEFDVIERTVQTTSRIDATLGKGGVIVFDHWSQPHCTRIALALREEYLRGKLISLCLTGTKLYGTWDSDGLTSQDLDDWAAAQPDIEMSYAHRLVGEVRRYFQKNADGLSPARAAAVPPVPALRRAIWQLAPPILAR